MKKAGKFGIILMALCLVPAGMACAGTDVILGQMRVQGDVWVQGQKFTQSEGPLFSGTEIVTKEGGVVLALGENKVGIGPGSSLSIDKENGALRISLGKGKLRYRFSPESKMKIGLYDKVSLLSAEKGFLEGIVAKEDGFAYVSNMDGNIEIGVQDQGTFSSVPDKTYRVFPSGRIELAMNAGPFPSKAPRPTEDGADYNYLGIPWWGWAGGGAIVVGGGITWIAIGAAEDDHHREKKEDKTRCP